MELDSLTLLLRLQKCDLDVDSWLSKLEYEVTIEAWRRFSLGLKCEACHGEALKLEAQCRSIDRVRLGRNISNIVTVGHRMEESLTLVEAVKHRLSRYESGRVHNGDSHQTLLYYDILTECGSKLHM